MLKADFKESVMFEGVGCIEERDQLCVAEAAGALEEHVAALDEEERIRAASLNEAAVIFEANGGFGVQDGEGMEGAGLESERVAVVKDSDEGDRCDREQEEVEESFRDQDAQASCSSDALLAAELHQMEMLKPLECVKRTEAAFPALGATVDVTKVELKLGRRQLAALKREQRVGGDPLRKKPVSAGNQKGVKIPSLNRASQTCRISVKGRTSTRRCGHTVLR
jgi:hypothetical protein